MNNNLPESRYNHIPLSTDFIICGTQEEKKESKAFGVLNSPQRNKLPPITIDVLDSA